MYVWWELQVSRLSVVELEKAEPTATGNLLCVKFTIYVWAVSLRLMQIYEKLEIFHP